MPGIMIALIPAEAAELAEIFEHPDYPEAEIHLTLGFFGDTEDEGTPTTDDLVSAITPWLNSMNGEFTAEATHLSAFGADSESIVIEVPDPDLHVLRAEMVDALEAAGITPDDRFAYRPHITLATDVTIDEGPLDVPLPVTFNAVWVAVGDEDTFFEIGEPVGPENEQPTAARTAMLARVEGNRVVIATPGGDVALPIAAELNELNFNDPIGAPVLPPREWFTEIPDQLLLNQIDGDITAVLQGEELGRAWAIYYDHDVCYMNEPGECWVPPASPSGNEAFVIGTMPYSQFDMGEDIHVGAIPITGGHTDTSIDSFDDARAARNDTPENQRLVGALYDIILPRQFDMIDGELVPNEEAGERQVGLFLGSLVPETTVAEAMMISRSGLSGEWWPREGFVDLNGDTVNQLVLDAMGPVLVTKAAIPTNRGGQANATIDVGYARAASGAWRGPIRNTRSGEPMKVKDITVSPRTACAQCAIKKKVQGKTAACCKACGDAEEQATAAGETSTVDADETLPTEAAVVAEGDLTEANDGDDLSEGSDDGDVASLRGELSAAMERIGDLEGIVMEHESILAQINASGVDAEEQTTASRLADERATRTAGRVASIERKVAQLPEGLTYNALREEISSAVRASETSDDDWRWLVDFDDDTVTYEIDDDSGIRNVQQGWSFADGNVTLTGNPVDVVMQFVPAPGGEAPAADAPADAPADDAAVPAPV